VSETISITFKFKRGDKVRDTSCFEDRVGVIDTRSYYECKVPELTRVQYSVTWEDGSFTVPISEGSLELFKESDER
jgi:hypothetical protein